MPFSSVGAYLSHITPRPSKQVYLNNYLSFDDSSGGGTFAQQFLPEIYEKEVERFGKRTISGFLSMVGAEMPMASDQVIWSEQGRLHIAYSADANNDGANAVEVIDASANTIKLPANNLIQNHDTIVIASSDSSKVLKAIVVAGGGTTSVTVAPYTQSHLDDTNSGPVVFADGDDINVFVYGTEYRKGSSESSRKIDAPFTQFSNKPMILRDRYQISGSDTAQIGWVEVTTEEGASGYLWYLKSESEARLRFNDYLEMAMVEAEDINATGNAGANFQGTGDFAITGSEGLFAALESRGLVFTGTDFDVFQALNSTAGPGGTPSAQAYVSQQGLGEFDVILQELDKQGAIEENMMFLDRSTSLEIDNMLASLSSGFVGGVSYGVFNNAEDMALNLGFSGFRRGSYDFYKTDWKYLNDSVTRGLVGDIEGVIVPAGTSTVYDEQLGKNIQRPFLHVRYRASEADDRKMKSWITGSVGGNFTSDVDEMVVNFLSERCLCVQAANNFVLLKN